MTKRMLIDATHSEETRVAVIDQSRLVDFDYESTVRKQLKGSIFLAKVTRVEPSLQAAFVNFGGNRHGFLPFSEIHPDYYRIPISDREAILAEQEEEMAKREAEEEAEDEQADDDEDIEDDEDDIEDEDDEDEENSGNKSQKGKGNNKKGGRGRRGGRGKGRRSKRSRGVEHVGGDGVDGDHPKRPSLRRNYKIQEVVKRGQIMLIQVSKEERGNKGAAVTSYLSLPGRYCVLMPNSPRAGGVSRKIANFKDRKRMREILKELNVPEGMSVILRTAGVERTKTEIKRDLDYLLKLWNDIRELTLNSTAPSVIHEEGYLTRRSIRDIYTRDIEEVYVAGSDGYKNAKKIMKMMIPSHAKKVKEYTDDKIPLFQRYHVENQINEIGTPEVVLPSGGYLVINPTEALVSIDVNSGRATKERHIEETALNTNLEAAEEVARQLRLRDLGGLVVIDFIDMEDRRNNRKVEQRLKQALSSDRARIQIGRISTFGLLELSRQRLNPSLTEAQFMKCEHCEGIGYVRSVDSTAIIALRSLEEAGVKGIKDDTVTLKTSHDVAMYILNNKRDQLGDIEDRYGFSVVIEVCGSDETGSLGYVIFYDGQDQTKSKSQEQSLRDQKTSNNNNNRKGGRRRGRRGGRNRSKNNRNKDDNDGQDDSQDSKGSQDSKDSKGDDKNDDKPKKKSSRGRGRKKKDDSQSGSKNNKDDSKSKSDNKSDDKSGNKDDKKSAKDDKQSDKKDEKKDTKSKGRGRKSSTTKKSAEKKDDKADGKQDSKADDKKKKSPAKKSSRSKKSDEDKTDKDKKSTNSAGRKASNDTDPKEYETVNEKPNEKKKGWWSR